MHASRGYVFNEVKHNSGAQPEIFQGRGGFAELGHFIKHFVKNTRKKVPPMVVKILDFRLFESLKSKLARTFCSPKLSLGS